MAVANYPNNGAGAERPRLISARAAGCVSAGHPGPGHRDAAPAPAAATAAGVLPAVSSQGSCIQLSAVAPGDGATGRGGGAAAAGQAGRAVDPDQLGRRSAAAHGGQPESNTHPCAAL